MIDYYYYYYKYAQNIQSCIRKRGIDHDKQEVHLNMCIILLPEQSCIIIITTIIINIVVIIPYTITIIIHATFVCSFL